VTADPRAAHAFLNTENRYAPPCRKSISCARVRIFSCFVYSFTWPDDGMVAFVRWITMSVRRKEHIGPIIIWIYGRRISVACLETIEIILVFRFLLFMPAIYKRAYAVINLTRLTRGLPERGTPRVGGKSISRGFPAGPVRLSGRRRLLRRTRCFPHGNVLKNALAEKTNGFRCTCAQYEETS